MGRNLGPLNIKDSYEGLVQISGSQLTDGSGSLITDLTVTASDATLATTASYAVSASHAVFADTAGSAPDANALYTASISDATINFLKGGGGTFNIEVNNVSSSISSSYAVTADTATSASHAVNADTAISSSYALTASFAENAGTPNLQQVLDEGSIATGSIELYDVAFAESLLLNFHSNGGAVYSGRGNSILNLGVNQGGQTDLITLGANGAIGFYGNNSGGNFNNQYNWGANKGWISGSLAIQQEFTASGLNYPTTDGTSGQVIGTDGLGNLSFITAGGGGGGDTSGLVSGSAPNSLISQFYTTTDALADGSGSIAIGDNAQVTGSTSDNTIVIGKDADSKENSVRNVIIGYNAYMTEANRNDSVIIGANANGYQEGVAIGADTFAIFGAVALGRYAYTNDNYGVAIGYGARANNTGGIAFGSGSLSDGNNSIAIGQGAHATAEGDVVLYNGVKNVYEYDKSVDTTSVSSSLVVDNWLNSRFVGISGSDGTNMSLGTGSLANITSGVRNTAMGSYYLDNPASNLYSAGYQITSGNDNTLYGVGAGTRITSGQGNVGIGVLTLGGTTTGQENVALGPQALRDNNGSYNIGIGKWSGYNAAGNYGIHIGYRTGFTAGSGFNNIFLGPNVQGQGASAFSLSNTIAIGSDLEAADNLLYGNHETGGSGRFLTINGDLIVTGSVTNDVGVLTDLAGTTTMDCSTGNFFTLTMPAGGSTTLTPSNIQAGQTINVKITQNATPSTIAFAASVDFEGGTPFAVSTGAGQVDVMTFISFDGTTLQATGLKNFS